MMIYEKLPSRARAFMSRTQHKRIGLPKFLYVMSKQVFCRLRLKQGYA